MGGREGVYLISLGKYVDPAFISTPVCKSDWKVNTEKQSTVETIEIDQEGGNRALDLCFDDQLLHFIHWIGYNIVNLLYFLSKYIIHTYNSNLKLETPIISIAQHNKPLHHKNVHSTVEEHTSIEVERKPGTKDRSIAKKKASKMTRAVYRN
jgi:hypothetical protein